MIVLVDSVRRPLPRFLPAWFNSNSARCGWRPDRGRGDAGRVYEHEVGLTTQHSSHECDRTRCEISDGKRLEKTGVTPDEIKASHRSRSSSEERPRALYRTSCGITIDERPRFVSANEGKALDDPDLECGGKRQRDTALVRLKSKAPSLPAHSEIVSRRIRNSKSLFT